MDDTAPAVGRLGCHEEGWLFHQPVPRFPSCPMLRGSVKILNKNSSYNTHISFNQSCLLTFCPIYLIITSIYIFFLNHLKVYCLCHTPPLPLNFSVPVLLHHLSTVTNFRQYNDAILKIKFFIVHVLGFPLTQNVFYRISPLASIKEFQSRIIYWI